MKTQEKHNPDPAIDAQKIEEFIFDSISVDEGECYAVYLDGKRPFGNSDIADDLLAHLKHVPEGEDGHWSDHQVAYAVKIYKAVLGSLRKKYGTGGSHTPGGRTVTCVYCGHAYPQGTGTWNDDVLTEHIKICPKHPMREAEATIASLRAELAQITTCGIEPASTGSLPPPRHIPPAQGG